MVIAIHFASELFRDGEAFPHRTDWRLKVPRMALREFRLSEDEELSWIGRLTEIHSQILYCYLGAVARTVTCDLFNELDN